MASNTRSDFETPHVELTLENGQPGLTYFDSQDTVNRAEAACVTIYSTDEELVSNCDAILSVAPPRDAAEIANRVVSALASEATKTRRASTDSPLYFADMNAVAPSTARQIASLFESAAHPVHFVDGSIIGGPPSVNGTDWSVPAMYMSGPHRFEDIAGGWGSRLTEVLHMRHITEKIGAASGLKMCFASMSKGYTAIAIQAFTSAQSMGVLGELQSVLAEMAPERAAQTERGLVSMAPKAYRWVREMEEISKTHVEEGGFSPELFLGAAGVYRSVAEETVLGQEKIGKRNRGTSAQDIAKAMVEGLTRNEDR